jgi:hypothetical protein
LLEIKLSCMEVYDRDDARELARLEECRCELLSLLQQADPVRATVVSIPERVRGRARATA